MNIFWVWVSDDIVGRC